MIEIANDSNDMRNGNANGTCEKKTPIELIFGTYEEYLLGYTFDECEKTLKQSFATHSHMASIQSVASSGNFIASGGADDIIYLYNSHDRRCAGTITFHNNTVNCVEFTPDGSYLMTGSEDGYVAMFKVGSWQMEKQWKNAHNQSGVCAISIHPSNALAFSLGRNNTLRTWNLVKGRPAYLTNLASLGLGKFLNTITASPSGSYLAIPSNTTIFVISIRTCGIYKKIQRSHAITSLRFLKEEVLCFGEHKGDLICYNLGKEKELWNVKAASIRVKCILRADNYLITGDSEGEIVVWDLPKIRKAPVKIVSDNVGCRITCGCVTRDKF